VSQVALLFLIAIFTQIFIANSQDSSINYCITRPAECYPLIVPVCAFPANCTDGSCSQYFDNACFACQDATMHSYIPGECPEYVKPDVPIEVTPSEEEAQNPANEAEEEEEEEEDPTSENCPDLGIALQVNGVFVEGRFCCEIQPITCSLRSRPVCAVLYTCIGSSCQVTKRNSCEACLDSNVQLYIPGTCDEIYGSVNKPDGDFEPTFKDNQEEEYMLSAADVPLYNSEEKEIWISWHK